MGIGFVYIIVKQVQSSTTLHDLEQFVSPVLKGRLWQKPASLRAVKIVALVSKKGKIVERYGLLRIAPESEKKRVVKALNGKPLQDSLGQVGDYVIRHWNNDRRRHSLVHDTYPQNRRKADRRRTGLRTYLLKENVDY